MSQRSAWIAAAIATAEVSDPPRPSVVTRPVSLWMPWKPEITATSLRSLKRLTSSAPLMSRMRAEPCASLVRIGNCQPCQDRALTPICCRAMAKRPEVTCSPDATTASYSRASCSAAASRHHSTSRLVVPAMADTTTATSWPASVSRFTWRATLRMRSISATEVPPNFMTRRLMRVNFLGFRLEKAAIHTGAVWSKQPRQRNHHGPKDFRRCRIHRRCRRSRAVFPAGRDLVGCTRPDGALAQVQPDPARLYPRPGGDAFSARPQTARLPPKPARPRYRLRRRAFVGAAGAHRRRGGGRRSRHQQYRGGQGACGGSGGDGGLSLDHCRGAGRRGRALRRGARHGSGGARQRRGPLHPPLRRDG